MKPSTALHHRAVTSHDIPGCFLNRSRLQPPRGGQDNPQQLPRKTRGCFSEGIDHVIDSNREKLWDINSLSMRYSIFVNWWGIIPSYPIPLSYSTPLILASQSWSWNEWKATETLTLKKSCHLNPGPCTQGTHTHKLNKHQYTLNYIILCTYSFYSTFVVPEIHQIRMGRNLKHDHSEPIAWSGLSCDCHEAWADSLTIIVPKEMDNTT